MRKKYNRRSRDSRTTPPPPDNDSPNRNPSRRQPIPNKPTAIAQNSPRLDLLTWLTNFVAPVVEHMLPTSCRHCALSSWCHLWPDPSPTLAVHELRESCQNCCAVWEFSTFVNSYSLPFPCTVAVPILIFLTKILFVHSLTRILTPTLTINPEGSTVVIVWRGFVWTPCQGPGHQSSAAICCHESALVLWDRSRSMGSKKLWSQQLSHVTQEFVSKWWFRSVFCLF